MVEKTDLKHGVYILECVRHKKDTQNLRKKGEGDYVCPASKINAMNCQFWLRIIWQAETQNWQLISAILQHNHAMSLDPFVFTQHRDMIEIQIANKLRHWLLACKHHIYYLAKQNTLYANTVFLLREKIITIFSAVQTKELRRWNFAVRNLELKRFRV